MKRRQKPVTVVVERPEPTSIENIAYARREIEWYLEHEMKHCFEVKKEFLEKAAKNDPGDIDLSYLVKRYAEDIFLFGTKELEINSLKGFYEKSIDSQDGGVQYVLETLKKEQEQTISRLIESPYRHNSTCAVSNFHQECELRAKAEFWRPKGINRGVAGQVIRCLEKWLAAENETLDAFRK